MENQEIHVMREWKNSTFFALLEQELADRGSVRFRVKGVSMQPMLRNDRDEVELIPYKKELLQQSAICLFKFHGRHILHRYLKKEGDLLYFQGDNVLMNTEFCLDKDVVGIVSVIYRDGRCLPPISNTWRCRIKVHRAKQYFCYALSSSMPRPLKNAIKSILGIKKHS